MDRRILEVVRILPDLIFQPPPAISEPQITPHTMMEKERKTESCWKTWRKRSGSPLYT